MTYETYSQYVLHGMKAVLSPYYDSFPVSISPSDKEKFEVSARECHRFFKDLYQNMYENSNCYGLPSDKYPAEAEQLDNEFRTYLSASKIKDTDKRYLLNHAKKKSKARSAVLAVCDFMFSLGEHGIYENNSLVFDKVTFDECEKRVKIHTLERMGFSAETAENKITLTNCLYPNLFFAFHSFLKACADNKKLRFMFYRCDFRVFLPNFKWELDDVIFPLPKSDKENLIALDLFMKPLKYRWVIEFDGRYAYALKQGVIFRVELEYDRYFMYFRWPLKDGLSKDFFDRLQKTDSDLCRFVFGELLNCRHDCAPGYGSTGPENCGARVKTEYDGKTKYACTDMGLPVWEHTESGFERVKSIAAVIRQIYA